jgi:hypothetical protein
MCNSHPVTLLVFVKNEKKPKTKNSYLVFKFADSIDMPFLSIVFHLVLHYWIPLFKALLFLYNSHPVIPLVFEKK